MEDDTLTHTMEIRPAGNQQPEFFSHCLIAGCIFLTMVGMINFNAAKAATGNNLPH
ncbi:hypothetical protein D3C76_1773190 [compost metagenome]